ncbi:hypothetical protein C8J55DRAFT_169033 [Lentinula edodes]|uniref:Uncharacterized protein n=1 Tax=Lentinula lateritia TaxID=40482 RepID=A0A9W9E083_9AGAR|nr:hypothetical protein C8J55DRAFT_169033 [Lentinula edodes]
MNPLKIYEAHCLYPGSKGGVIQRGMVAVSLYHLQLFPLVHVISIRTRAQRSSYVVTCIQSVGMGCNFGGIGRVFWVLFVCY